VSVRIANYSSPTGYRGLTFDNASRITQISNYLGVSTTASGTQSFTYDNAGRLLSFNGYINNGNNVANITQTQSFTYDANGKRLTSKIGTATTSTYTTQTTSNRLTSITGGITKTNTYDTAGNLTNVGSTSLTYDGRGRMLTSTSAGLTTSYLINYAGQRVKKANSTETVYYIYDDSGHMIGEYDAAGTLIQELIWLGDTPVALRSKMPCLTGGTCTETANAYIWTDHLNTPREITRVNASNTHVSMWKWDSLPFGETLPNANLTNLGVMTFNHRFPGQYRDKETGLHQNWHRDYEPKLGRYVISDPIGLNAGMNTYSYAVSDPIRNSDPKGLDTYQCTGGLDELGGAAIGILHHEYLCVTVPLPSGQSGPPSMLCSGLGQNSGILAAILCAVPGIATNDSFNAQSCTPTSQGNGEFDACVRAVLEGPRPTYSAGPNGGPYTRNCQSFVSSSIQDCARRYGK